MSETKRQPWMKWYPRDWRGDGALRMCSFAARGLWADLTGLMHDEGEPYGFLLINGRVPTSSQLARILGGSAREIEGLLAELAAAGVYDVGAGDVIVCRRMVRDKAKAEADKVNGSNGGSPLFIRGTVPKEERTRRYRQSDSPAKTQRIFDKSGGKCHWCSVRLVRDWNREGEVPLNLFHVDHVVAVRDGGDNDEANLVASCRSCNGARAVHNGGVMVGTDADPKAHIPYSTCQESPPSPPQAGGLDASQGDGKPEAPSRANGTNPRSIAKAKREAEEAAALTQARLKREAEDDAKWLPRIGEFQQTGKWPSAWGAQPNPNPAISEAGVFLPKRLWPALAEARAQRSLVTDLPDNLRRAPDDAAQLAARYEELKNRRTA